MELRNFRITVEGKTFDVTVEEIGAEKNQAPPPKPVETKREVSPPVVQVAPQPAPAPASGTGKAVLAPMPGKIISIKVSKGDSITFGQTLLVMEAMKMEQEIKSTFDGTVSDILISDNETVRKNQQMILIS